MTEGDDAERPPQGDAALSYGQGHASEAPNGHEDARHEDAVKDAAPSWLRELGPRQCAMPKCGREIVPSEANVILMRNGVIGYRCPACRMVATVVGFERAPAAVKEHFRAQYDAGAAARKESHARRKKPTERNVPKEAPLIDATFGTLKAAAEPRLEPEPQEAPVTLVAAAPASLQSAAGREERIDPGPISQSVADALARDSAPNLRKLLLEELDKNRRLREQIDAATRPPGVAGSLGLGLGGPQESLLREVGLEPAFKGVIAMRLSRTLEEAIKNESLGVRPAPVQADGAERRPLDLRQMMMDAQRMAMEMKAMEIAMAPLKGMGGGNGNVDGNNFEKAVRELADRQERSFREAMAEMQRNNDRIFNALQQRGGGYERERQDPFERAMMYRALNGGGGDGNLSGMWSAIAQMNTGQMNSLATMMQANQAQQVEMMRNLGQGGQGGQNGPFQMLLNHQQQLSERDKAYATEMRQRDREMRDLENKWWEEKLGELSGQMRGKPESEFEQGVKDLFYTWMLKQVGAGGAAPEKSGMAALTDNLKDLLNGPFGTVLVDVIKNATSSGGAAPPGAGAAVRDAWEHAARQQAMMQQRGPVGIPMEQPQAPVVMAPPMPGYAIPPQMYPQQQMQPQQVEVPFDPAQIPLGQAQQFVPSPQQFIGPPTLPQEAPLPPVVQPAWVPSGQVGRGGNPIMSLPSSGARAFDLMNTRPPEAAQPQPPEEPQQPPQPAPPGPALINLG